MKTAFSSHISLILVFLFFLFPAVPAQTQQQTPSARASESSADTDETVTSSDLLLSLREAGKRNNEAGETETRMLLGRVSFDSNSAILEAGALELLAPVSALMAEPVLSGARLLLEGHSDAAGSAASNQEISEQRAQAVQDELVVLFGLPEARIETVGHGEDHLIENIGERAPDQRRVEIILVVETQDLLPEDPPELPEGVTLVDLSGAAQGQTLPLQVPFLGEDGQTVDFWVKADWDNRTSFDVDPVIYALSGLDGLIESLHITTTRDGLSYFNGDQSEPAYTRVPFDFSDGAHHHVTAVLYAGAVEFWIDGLPRGTALRSSEPDLATHLDIGGFDLSGPFRGEIGDLRLWSGPLTGEFIPNLMTAPGDPGPTFAAWSYLAARTTADPFGFGFALERFDPVHKLTNGPWTTYGSDHVHIKNLDAFSAGQAGADIGSRHLDSTDRSLVEDKARAATRNRELQEPLRQFSTYPLYILEREPARISPAHTPLFGSADGEAVTAKTEKGMRLSEVTFYLDAATDALTGLVLGLVPRGASVASDPVITGHGLKGEEKVLRLATDERIIGLTGSADTDTLKLTSVLTNRQVFEIIEAGSADTVTHYLPVSDPFGGFELRLGSDNAVTAIGLLSAADHTVPAVVMHEENGDYLRFEQTGRNTYTRAEDRDGIDTPQQLHVLGNELLQIDDVERAPGIAHDIVPIGAHDRASPDDPFDNVFIAQAKAVNLDASYLGYDATRMDPLHLVDNGTSKRVFQMPGAGSTSYHDFNRIFVPNGLIYVPEFTGRTEVATSTSSSTDDYQRQFSHTVGVNFNVAGAKFAASRTMRRAKRKIGEEKRTLSTSVARSLFYDLALDKARMPLDAEFRSRVERLSATGDYRGLLQVFGTHYPVAVVYGGMGVMEMEYDFESLSRMASEGVDVNYSAGVEAQRKAKGLPPTNPATKAAAGGNVGTSNAKQQTFVSVAGDQSENFYWVGGTHAGASKESWSVGVDGAVPVYVELRPLYELLAPPYFNDPEILHRLKFELRSETEKYLKEAAIRAERENEDSLPKIFSLDVGKMEILRRGDKNDEPMLMSLSVKDTVKKNVDVYFDAALEDNNSQSRDPRDLNLFDKRIRFRADQNTVDLSALNVNGFLEQRPKYYVVDANDLKAEEGIIVKQTRLHEQDSDGRPDPDDVVDQQEILMEWRDAVSESPLVRREVYNSRGCATADQLDCTIVSIEYVLTEIEPDAGIIGRLLGQK